ncbi:MAG: MFS transporter, partial [Burkholderiales bacterium]|nr:MFS transporter [Burkholderiales bacterium]
MSLFISVGLLSVPLLATHLEVSTLELGIIGSVSALTYTLTVVFAGALSDRLGRKRVIIAGALLTGLSFVFLPTCQDVIHLLFLMAICGCGMASFWPVLEAWLTEEETSEQRKKGLG